MLNKELEKQHEIVKKFLFQSRQGGFNSIDAATLDQNDSAIVLSLKRELD